MRFPWKTTLALILLVAGGGVAYPFARDYWKARNAPKFRTVKVERGEIISVVNATGTVQPKLRVQIGSFVSGPIVKLNVDFNDFVHKVDPKSDMPEAEKEKYLLAEIDPRLYLANVRRDEAAKARAEAEVKRVEALLAQAENDYKRAQGLQQENEDFISGTELDQYKYNYRSLEAQLNVAKASLEQAVANLENSKANLDYTKIYSPVDGIVIDRKIDEGQTLAAQFQTPELFIVAPDMDKEMYVYASVDEADIGLIRRAQETNQPVFFTVDAYPEDLFEGRIDQIRKNPSITQNVVTYPVVVTTPNPQMKLLPGMTANLSFQIEKRGNALKVPNAALRFYPKKEHVRQEDQKILEGTDEETADSDQAQRPSDLRSAMERVLARKERSRRYVWIKEGDKLRAVEIHTGLNDYEFTELKSGPLEAGQELVAGLENK